MTNNSNTNEEEEKNQSLFDQTTRIAEQMVEATMHKGEEAWEYTKEAVGNVLQNAKMKASDAS